jgi:UDP-N-acetylmuramate--alanine ligase
VIHQIKQAYFIGIGGIGMSAIARYFNAIGITVYGYDKTSTLLTNTLIEEGIKIHFDDDINSIDSSFLNANKEEVIVVITPAIPKDHKEYNFFEKHYYPIKKRAEVLGMITESTFTAAVAGTHGKTTTSTILTHILKSSGYDVTAFLGGIAKNYNNNFIGGLALNEPEELKQSLKFKMDVLSPTVVEADEYDRSFLTLHPDVAIVTSVDADHLDIYGDDTQLKESFRLFTSQIKSRGALITKQGLHYQLSQPSDVKVYKYALEEHADFFAYGIKIANGKYHFNIVSCVENINDICLGLPGLHNVENAVAAIAAAQLMGVLPLDIKKALKSFSGVNRRFDYRINTEDLVYIDDYAHHPEEIKACLNSIKQLYPDKKITGIFQPHLFSRTRDFAKGFSESLSILDEVILMDIYPARELPIPGVSSAMLLSDITSAKKQILNASEILNYLDKNQPEVLVTIGAGDIDQLIAPIEKLFSKVKTNE